MTKWVTKKLGEVCDILDNRRKPMNDEQREIGEYPYCGANGIVDYINIYEFDEPTILIAEDGGNFSDYEKKPIAYKMEGKYFVNNHAHVLKAKNDYIQDFIFYHIVHQDVNPVITGGTRSKLTRGELENIPIRIPALPDGTPDLAEQRRIAGILSSADGAIAASEALIEKYRNIKRGLLATLLQPKEGWKKVKLGECCEIGDGLHGTPKYDNTGDYFFINGNNLKDGVIYVKDATEKVNVETYNKYKIALTENTILMSINGTIGNLAYYKKEKIVLGKSVAYFKILKNLYTDFLYYYLQSYVASCYYELCLTGSTIKNLGLTQLREMEIQLPDLTEQRRIAEILSSVDAKIAAEEKVVEKYKGVKKGLMEEMMGSF